MSVLAAIVACEIGFWVVLVAGLAARYLLKWRRLSSLLLLCVPLLDVALLAFITWDLMHNDAVADFTHGLGAVYLGATVAFGHRIISWADVRVAHRFAGGPPPTTVPKHGRARVIHEWMDWARMVLCAVISTVVLGGIIFAVDDASRTDELHSWIGRVWLVTGIWLIGWPLWETLREALRPSSAVDDETSQR